MGNSTCGAGLSLLKNKEWRTDGACRREISWNPPCRKWEREELVGELHDRLSLHFLHRRHRQSRCRWREMGKEPGLHPVGGGNLFFCFLWKNSHRISAGVKGSDRARVHRFPPIFLFLFSDLLLMAMARKHLKGRGEGAPGTGEALWCACRWCHRKAACPERTRFVLRPGRRRDGNDS